MTRPSLDEKRAARNKLEADYPGISTGITAKGVKVYLMDVFPTEVDGVPIEVEYIGRVVA